MAGTVVTSTAAPVGALTPISVATCPTGQAIGASVKITGGAAVYLSALSSSPTAWFAQAIRVDPAQTQMPVTVQAIAVCVS